MTTRDVTKLTRLAAELRLNIVRMMGSNKAHHFGGSMSAADIISALYFYKMRYDPAHPDWPDRDRFIMSKGHCVPAQYAALAMIGVFPLEELPTLKVLGSRLQGHPAMQLLPGIEGCTGSLGQGLSYANGMALAARVEHRNYQVYCLIGDGEMQEGQIWEAALSSAKLCLGNITAFVDRNGLKAMDATSCGKQMEPMASRWRSFGWAVQEIDGHSMAELCDALDWADTNGDQPSLIIARTTKGKGISFIENRPEFHNAALSDEQLDQVLVEMETRLNTLQEA